MGPIMGIVLKNVTTTPNTSPKRPSIPNDSIENPTNVRLQRINAIPVIKHIEPRLFVGLEKNARVAEGPIRSVTPITKRMLPSARSALSKSVKIPHVKKSAPPKVKAAPNSVLKYFFY